MPHQQSDVASAPLRPRDRLHILGRALMALGIGWGYLGVVVLTDAAGLASWAAASPIGMVAMAQIWSVVGVVFASVGAHIGWVNVAGEAARAHAAAAVARRGELRAMGRRR